MRIDTNDLENYLGNDETKLENSFNSSTLEKLIRFRDCSREEISIPDYLFKLHQTEGYSIRKIAEVSGVSSFTISKIFSVYELPLLTKEESLSLKWKDEDFRKRNAEGVRLNWKDEDFRKRNAEGVRQMLYERWKDEDFRERQAEGVRLNWKDEDFRKRNAEGVRRNWKDEDFRKRNAEGVRQMLHERWKDEDFRERHAEGVRLNWKDEDFRKRNAEGVRQMLHERWKDEDFRERHAEGVRKARHNPQNHGRYYIPTISGYREDLKLHANSSWEANLGRAILFTGREMSYQVPLKLKVNEEHRDLFNLETTETSIDYLTTDNRGNLIGYEIIAHPLESNVDWAKIEMVSEQYSVRVVPVTKRVYQRIEQRFRKRIEESEVFIGWEDSNDNLKTNPGKYNPVEK
jgi:AraC-like DNA-binding protein